MEEFNRCEKSKELVTQAKTAEYFLEFEALMNKWPLNMRIFFSEVMTLINKHQLTTDQTELVVDQLKRSIKMYKELNDESPGFVPW